MFTLQHSPPVLCADVVEEVNFHEHPGPPDLRPWNLAGPSLVLERDRMNLEQGSGLLQVERAHGSPAIRSETINEGAFPPYYWAGGRGTCRAVRPLRRPAVPAVGFPPISYAGEGSETRQTKNCICALRHGEGCTTETIKTIV